jgi:hypothetical protein
VLRNRPDVVREWSDVEVARRWWRLFPLRRNEDGSPADPAAHELRMLTADADKLAELRRRLSSVSWFMRCLAELIARRRDCCTGRFWEGRFKCQPLLDESAVAACLAYVDLNPIRAGIAKTPETSRFTSAYERIQAEKDAAITAANPSPAQPAAVSVSRRTPSHAAAAVADAKSSRSATATPARRAAWLSPLEVARDHASEASQTPAARASNRGCLPMSLADYLRLLDWTGRQLRRDKRGAIPSDVAPILERLHTTGEGWLALVKDFSRLFRRAAGTPTSLAREAQRHDRRWLQGVSRSRQVFI